MAGRHFESLKAFNFIVFTTKAEVSYKFIDSFSMQSCDLQMYKVIRRRFKI